MRSNPVFLQFFCDKCETWYQVVRLARRIYPETFCPGGYITIDGVHLFKQHFLTERRKRLGEKQNETTN